MTERAATHVLDGSGLACIHLTPRISNAARELPPGALLEVSTDDPAAREGVPSWCRLTNNSLLDTIEHDTSKTTFIIQTKNNEREQS